MLVSNVDRADLESALKAVNEVFDGNIKFRSDPDFVGHSRAGKFNKYRFTLSVVSSAGPGARRSVSPWGVNKDGGRRKISAACWHVYGAFFDSLPLYASIRASGRTIRPGDPWLDRNIGSMMYPCYYSDACECDGDLAYDAATIGGF